MDERTQQPEGESLRSKAKTDLRVLKTRRAIYEAFAQLLTEKPFSDITVQNIIDRALVNRKTFYNHFRSKYDLAEQTMISIGNSLRQTAERMETLSETGHLQKLYAALQGYRTEVLALWDVKTDREESLSNLLTNILAEMYLNWAQSSQDEQPRSHSETADGAKPSSASPDEQLQARLYATIATASLKFILESNGDFDVNDIRCAMTTVTEAIVAVMQPKPVASMTETAPQSVV